ncbi:hypothetical protein C8F01DRAFT_1187267 [Mycena amicta]|nr:hypothetical protein C8F01DRAFT_1187267 [Mycena amicta]
MGYNKGDVVLAKIGLFPFLPGMIMNVEDVPPRISRMRPTGKHNNTYPVRLFTDGEYYWAADTLIQRLLPEQIHAFLAGSPDATLDKKLYGVGNRRVLKAYLAAAEPDAWESRLASAATEHPTTEKKGIDREHPETTLENAELDVHDAASAEPTSLITASDDSEDERTCSNILRAPSPEEFILTESRRLELEEDPEALKVQRWRVSLQRTLLRNDATSPSDIYSFRLATPDQTEMHGLNDLFSQMETYEQMTAEYIVFSKIDKMMRWIHLLGPLRFYHDEAEAARLHERANALAGRWVRMRRGLPAQS